MNLYLAYNIGLHQLAAESLDEKGLSPWDRGCPPAAQYVIDAQNQPMYTLSHMKD